jgi:hypothetical protein
MNSWFYDDVKKRKSMSGMKTKSLDKVFNDRERSDLVCPIRGDNDLLDFAGNFDVCDKCFSKFASFEGVIAHPIYPMGLNGESKCVLCGKNLVKQTIFGRNSWHIVRMPISLKEMWHKLGGQRKSLKIFGERIFY